MTQLIGTVIVVLLAIAVCARRLRHPSKPWLWEKGAESHELPDYGPSGQPWQSWVVAAVLGGFTYVAFVRPPDQGATWIPLVMPVLTGLAIAYAVRATYRRWRIGGTVCRINAVPVRPGERLDGELVLSAADFPPMGVLLRLTCKRSSQDARPGADVGEVLEPDCVFAAEKLLREDEVSHEERRFIMPFSFLIPPDAPSTYEDRTVDGDNYYCRWVLEASGEAIGGKYEACFRIPVFGETGAAPDGRSSRSPA